MMNPHIYYDHHHRIKVQYIEIRTRMETRRSMRRDGTFYILKHVRKLDFESSFCKKKKKSFSYTLVLESLY